MPQIPENTVQHLLCLCLWCGYLLNVSISCLAPSRIITLSVDKGCFIFLFFFCTLLFITLFHIYQMSNKMCVFLVFVTKLHKCLAFNMHQHQTISLTGQGCDYMQSWPHVGQTLSSTHAAQSFICTQQKLLYHMICSLVSP